VQRANGFALFELLIIILILSIVMMIGFPSVTATLNDARLSAAAAAVVDALEYAQLISSGSVCKTRVTLDAVADAIVVEQFQPSANLFSDSDELVASDVEGGTFAPMQNPMKKGSDYRISLPAERRFGTASLVAVVFDNGEDNVIFGDTIRPSTGGSIALALGNRAKLVTLDGMTGRVTVTD